MNNKQNEVAKVHNLINQYRLQIEGNPKMSSYNKMIIECTIAMLYLQLCQYQSALTVLNGVCLQLQQAQKQYIEKQYQHTNYQKRQKVLAFNIQYGVLSVKVQTGYLLIYLAGNSVQDIEEHLNRIMMIIARPYVSMQYTQSQSMLYSIVIKTLIGFESISDFIRSTQREEQRISKLPNLCILSLSFLLQLFNQIDLSYKLSAICFESAQKQRSNNFENTVLQLLSCKHLLTLTKKYQNKSNLKFSQGQLEFSMQKIMQGEQIYGVSSETLFRHYEQKIHTAVNIFKVFYQFQSNHVISGKKNNESQVWVCRAVISRMEKYLVKLKGYGSQDYNHQVRNINKTLQLLKSYQKDNNIEMILKIIKSSNKNSLVTQVENQWRQKLSILIYKCNTFYVKQVWKSLLFNHHQKFISSHNISSSHENNNEVIQVKQIKINKYIEVIKESQYDKLQNHENIEGQKSRIIHQKQRLIQNNRENAQALQKMQENRYIAHIKHQNILNNGHKKSENNDAYINQLTQNRSQLSKSPKNGKKFQKINIIINATNQQAGNKNPINSRLMHDIHQNDQSCSSKIYLKYRRGIYSPIRSDYGGSHHPKSQLKYKRQNNQNLTDRSNHGNEEHSEQKFTEYSRIEVKRKIHINYQESHYEHENMKNLNQAELKPENSNNHAKKQQQQGSQGGQQSPHIFIQNFHLQNQSHQKNDNKNTISKFTIEEKKIEEISKKKQSDNQLQQNHHQNDKITDNKMKQFIKIDQKTLKSRKKKKYTPERKIQKLLKLCQAGQYFMKRHYSSDGGQQKFVQIDTDSKVVRWSSDEQKLKSGKFQSYKIKDIKGIVYGKVTETMIKQCNKNLEPWRCFSLILKKRTLDFYAIEDVDLYIWLPGLTQSLSDQTLPLSNPKSSVAQNVPISLYSPGRALWKRMLLKLQFLFIKQKKGHKKHYKNANAHAIILFGRANMKINISLLAHHK